MKRQLDLLRESEDRMKEAYLSHNAHVINTVPADRLLIWNLKVNLRTIQHFFDRFNLGRMGTTLSISPSTSTVT